MFALLFACATPSPISSAPEAPAPLVCEDGRYWAPSADIETCVDATGAFHGDWRRWSGDVVVAELHYVHGVQDGGERRWHDSGALALEGRWDAGAQVGVWQSYGETGLAEWSESWVAGELVRRAEFDAAGALRSELYFQGGQRHGTASWYYGPGQPQSLVTYQDGAREGLELRWHADGGLESAGMWDADARDGTWIHRAQDGAVSEEIWDQGALVATDGDLDASGASSLRCPAGTCAVVTTLERGQVEVCQTPSGTRHGGYVARYADGSLRTVGAYAAGAPDGAWSGWCLGGMPSESGSYQGGDRVGSWSFWACDGTLLRTEDHGGDDRLAGL
jgi:antitoxin component YwqK of YwqJK toxin-antitoxin module